MKAGLWFISLTIITPFPGSKLFERLKKEDRIVTFNWKKYDCMQYVIFRPKNMSRAAVRMWYLTIRVISLCLSPLFLMQCMVATALVCVVYYLTFYLASRLFYF